jgi:glucose dehydrogenase
MPARTRDTICLLACAVLGAVIWAIHETSLSHAVQRPLKIAVIVVGLGLIGLWRTQQIRRADR